MKGQEGSIAGGADELLNLLEIDPNALREAEFVQAQAILDTMVGETIASAEMEEGRIVVETATGNRYFFYGFMGNAPRGARTRR
jgi:hypothetical protein